MFRPEAPKWYVREMSGMTHSLPFRTSGNRIHMSQSHIWKCNNTQHIISVYICSLGGNLHGLWLYVKWALKFALRLVQPTTILNIKAYKPKEMTDERNSKQLLKATSLSSVNDKGHYTYNGRNKLAGHDTVMGLLQHSQAMT
jgi:hypothetical protein